MKPKLFHSFYGSFCLVETKICVATEKFFKPSYWDGKFNAHESDVKLSCARLVGVFPPKPRFFGAKRHLHWVGWDEEGWQVFALTFSIHENYISEQRILLLLRFIFFWNCKRLRTQKKDLSSLPNSHYHSILLILSLIPIPKVQHRCVSSNILKKVPSGTRTHLLGNRFVLCYNRIIRMNENKMCFQG